MTHSYLFASGSHQVQKGTHQCLSNELQTCQNPLLGNSKQSGGTGAEQCHSCSMKSGLRVQNSVW